MLHGRLGNAPVVLTRWVLVIAISCAVILSADGPVPLWPHQIFIAVILGSNLVLAWVLSRGKSWRMLSGWATGLDIAADLPPPVVTYSQLMAVKPHVDSFRFQGRAQRLHRGTVLARVTDEHRAALHRSLALGPGLWRLGADPRLPILPAPVKLPDELHWPALREHTRVGREMLEE